MQQQADEDELGLSSAALAALKEFALENDLLVGLEGGGGSDDSDVRLQVQERMDVKEKTHEFRFCFGDDADEDKVSIELTGINPELGQTLASTGLTVWRAAEEMARFMWEHRRWFAGKRVVELGSGLGLCGVLASKLCTGGKVVITDGGEEFTDSAMDALRRNLEKNSCNNVIREDRGCEDRSFSFGGSNLLTDSRPAPGSATSDEVGGGVRGLDDGTASSPTRACATSADVSLERLTWGKHGDFLERYSGGDGGGAGGVNEGGRGVGGFDFIVAADVIYEEEAVSPLLHTVVDILRLRLWQDSQDINENNNKSTGNRTQASSWGKRALDREGEHTQRLQAVVGGVRHDQNEAKVEAQGETGKTGEGSAEYVAAAAVPADGRSSVSPLPLPPAQPPTSSFCSSSPPPTVPTFLLAFARRNVSIERVLREAESLGLQWRLPDDFEPTSSSENVYLMHLGYPAAGGKPRA